jgi:hypothetical protein
MANTVLKAATEHFRSQLSEGLKSIEVKEWNSTVYFKPASTFAQQQRALELHAQGKMVEALVETLIARALDAEGKRLFTSADKAVLMNEVDPQIIIQIVSIMNTAEKAVEAEMGN